MFQLVYMSSATRWPSQADLEAVLRESRDFNQRHDITGMLLYHNAQFIQLLEGDEHEVRALYERIRRDDRHTGVVTLVEREVDAREFADWHMGFRDLDKSPPPPGYADVFGDGFDRDRLLAGGDQLVRLLRRFAEAA